MWLMILIAVHVNNPQDVPARLTIPFESQQACESAIPRITYWVKFEQFKIEAKCQKLS
jgi:hypothetical protein